MLPPESARWTALVGRFAQLAGDAGYGLLQGPMFEDAAVFRRVGEGTDVVRKEMYEFDDKGGRHLALRPEGTASVVRAYVQHQPAVAPWKVWYAAPNFRYERPQAGRYRQHHQLGLEAIGSDDADLDVEVIVLAADYLSSLGLSRVRLQINSMGSAQDREAYVELLGGWLATRRGDIDPVDAEKIDTHPMRVLDSKRPVTQSVIADAPRIAEVLTAEATARFDRVQHGLRAVGVDFEVAPRLVRGLDYYTHTTFEFVSDALDAAQSTVLGGGRYDGLVEALGGRPTPGIGFGSGIERVLLACDAEEVFSAQTKPLDVFVVDLTDGAQAVQLTTQLRRAGLSADRAFDARSMRAQMKAADRSGARLAVIVGAREVADGVVGVRRLRSDAETGEAAQVVVERRALLDEVRRLLAHDSPH